MQSSASKRLSSLSLARAVLVPTLVLMLLGAPTPRLVAQSSDFNTSQGGTNDTGWTHYALADYPPTYSFPAVGSGDYAYEIYAPPTGSNPYSLRALAGSYREDVLYAGRFSTGADLLTWNATWNQYVGLLFYLQSIDVNSIQSYVATYAPYYKTIYITAVYGLSTIFNIGKLPDGAVVLEPTRGYRLVASSHDGYTYLLQVFDKSQPNSPWTSVICQDTPYFANTTNGLCGLFVLQHDYPSTTAGADATFDNYVAVAPAAGAMRTAVTDLSPPPAGQAAAFYPTVTVGILDRDTTVVTNSIVLCLDGVWIPNGSLTIDPQVHKPSNPLGPTDFGGATVTCRITNLLAGGEHTNSVAFLDSAGTWQTNIWTWTLAYPCSLPTNSLSVRGLDVRMVQSTNANIGGSGGLNNSVASANAVLAYQYPVDLAATNIVQQVAWGLHANEYGAITNFPGLCIPPANVNSYAIETLAYLQLTAGTNRFYVDSDDAVGVYSGTNLTDRSTVLLENNGVTHKGFDFVVPANGLYPFHIIYEEGAGAAYLVLKSVNLSNNTTNLVNAAGGVKAFYPLVCESSTSVAGPYTVDAAANAGNVLTTANVLCGGTGAALNQKVTGGTLTIPVSDPARFYRLNGPRTTSFTNATRTGSNVVITYQAN
jgi:hypothetical protein